MDKNAILLYFKAIIICIMTILSAVELEQQIQRFEQQHAVCVTIIDREGFFHDHDGRPLFSRQRHSHQKSAVCKTQFDQRCIDHCRHAINKRSLKQRLPFEHCCWKGVSEITVPLYLEGSHLGTCYVGQWQSRDRRKRPHRDSTFKQTLLRHYDALPQHDAARIQSLLPAARFLAQSLVLHVEQLKNNRTDTDPRLQHIMDFIQRSPGVNLSLSTLAAYLHVSSSRCSHLVKELSGRSLHELILDERMRRAKHLLCSSERSAQEIADIIGFSDAFYFNKVFKRATGLPPGRFRRQFR